MLVLSLAGLGSVKRWSSPAGRPNRPLHLIFWTNWWDAHLATMLASDPTSKVANTRWWRCSLWGGTPPSSLAQVWDNCVRWINREPSCVCVCAGRAPVILSHRVCHLFPPSFMSCAVTLPRWPIALGYSICAQTFPSDCIFLHQRWAVIITCHPCGLVTHEWGQNIPPDTSPSVSGVTFHIYFKLTLHPFQLHAG